MRRLAYAIRQALNSIRQSPSISILTSGTMAAALTVCGLYLSVLQGLESLTHVWGRSTQVTAILEGQDQGQWNKTAAAIKAQDTVLSTKLVLPEEALKNFRARGPNMAQMVEGVDPKIFPAMVHVTLPANVTNVEGIRDAAATLEKIEGVSEVDYGEAEYLDIERIVSILQRVGLVLGALVALATAFIVSNTIRLTVFSRREEIGILTLVGATKWFIRGPFVLEGALWGLVGAGMAIGILYVGEAVLGPWLTSVAGEAWAGLVLHVFQPNVALILLVAGMGLGVIGALVAVGRFLEAETP